MSKKILSWLFILGLSGTSAAFAAEGCTINRIEGDVQLMRDHQWTSVKVKDSFQKGDTLQTGGQCSADLAMNGLAGCRILASSQVDVMGSDSANMSLKVVKGNVILNLRKLPKESSFQVETPSAVAVVRGTQFWGRVLDSECLSCAGPKTTIAVREGTVQITHKATSKVFSLTKGQALDMVGTTTPTLRQALPAEMQAMEQANAIRTSE